MVVVYFWLGLIASLFAVYSLLPGILDTVLNYYQRRLEQVEKHQQQVVQETKNLNNAITALKRGKWGQETPPITDTKVKQGVIKV